MNREIKFRVFDNETKRMSYDKLKIGRVLKSHLTGMTGDGLSSNEYDSGRYEILQYTGLKDKNGKEIYEGDIIRQFSNPTWHSKVDELYVIEFIVQDLGSYSYQQTIGWNATPISHYVKDINVSKGILDLCFNHPGINVEIIGTIYENPNLLTD